MVLPINTLSQPQVAVQSKLSAVDPISNNSSNFSSTLGKLMTSTSTSEQDPSLPTSDTLATTLTELTESLETLASSVASLQSEDLQPGTISELEDVLSALQEELASLFTSPTTEESFPVTSTQTPSLTLTLTETITPTQSASLPVSSPSIAEIEVLTASLRGLLTSLSLSVRGLSPEPELELEIAPELTTEIIPPKITQTTSTVISSNLTSEGASTEPSVTSPSPLTSGARLPSVETESLNPLMQATSKPLSTSSTGTPPTSTSSELIETTSASVSIGVEPNSTVIENKLADLRRQLNQTLSKVAELSSLTEDSESVQLNTRSRNIKTQTIQNQLAFLRIRFIEQSAPNSLELTEPSPEFGNGNTPATTPASATAPVNSASSMLDLSTSDITQSETGFVEVSSSIPAKLEASSSTPKTSTVLSQTTVNVENFETEAKDFIVRQLRFTESSTSSQAVLKLTPEGLGKVDVRLVLEGGRLTATFVAETEAGRKSIEGKLNQLTQSLIQQGIQVEKVSVQSSNPSQGAMYQQNQQEHNQRNSKERDRERERKQVKSVDEVDSPSTFAESMKTYLTSLVRNRYN